MGKFKNNFNKKVKMHLACASDELRPVMNCIYFKEGFAYASDGVILAKNRISEISGLNDAEIEALNGKLLHRDFYKDMLKYDELLISEEGIECHKGDDKAFFYFSNIEGKYPNADMVLQDALNKKNDPVSQITFSVNNMTRLNESLYESDRCTVNFKGQFQPIVLYSMDEDVSSVGLLMPINPM